MFVTFMGNAVPKLTSRTKSLCWLTFPEDEGHNGSEEEAGCSRAARAEDGELTSSLLE